jgi:hypothetical protein
MVRGKGLAGVIAIFGLAGLGQAQEAYSIKLREADKGATVFVEKTETIIEKSNLTDAGGKALRDKDEKGMEEFAYHETILEKPSDNKLPTRVRRRYEKATVKTGDKVQALPYQGKTVINEEKDGKYHFRFEGGDELTGDNAQYLDREFNRAGNRALDWKKLLLPSQEVEVGATWQIDTQALARQWERGIGMEIDAAKATASGTLRRVYQKDGRRFGVLELSLELPLTAFDRARKLPLLPGSRMIVHMTADACIDGSVDACVKDGTQSKLTLAVESTSKETRKEEAKK